MRSIPDKTTMIPSISPPSPSPSGPSLIIFYQRREDVQGIPGVFFLGNHELRSSLLHAFDTRVIRTLFVHISQSSGWRTRLTPSDCVILFAGGPYQPEEVHQALGRVTTPPDVIR